jgi:hypothetical protein
VGHIVGQEYRGNWWSLPSASLVYNALQPLRDDVSILVCRLVQRKVTYVDHESWVPLAALACRLPDGALDRVNDVHTSSGRHVTKQVALHDWLEPAKQEAASLLGDVRALKQLDARVSGIGHVLGLED